MIGTTRYGTSRIGSAKAFAASKKYVFDRLASRVFKPRVDKRFPLSQIVEAHRYMESNQQIGKIVVTVVGAGPARKKQTFPTN